MRLLSELPLLPLSWRRLQDCRLCGCSKWHLVHVPCLQGTVSCQHCRMIKAEPELKSFGERTRFHYSNSTDCVQKGRTTTCNLQPREMIRLYLTSWLGCAASVSFSCCGACCGACCCSCWQDGTVNAAALPESRE